MLNKQIFEIETDKLLVKNPSEKWEDLTFFVVAVIVVVVCLFVFPSWFFFLVSLF